MAFYSTNVPLGHVAITGISLGSTRSSMLFFCLMIPEIPIELRTATKIGPLRIMLSCKIRSLPNKRKTAPFC
jgi:hypothetical protein